MAANKTKQEVSPAQVNPASRTASKPTSPVVTDKVSEVIARVKVLLQESKPQEAFDRINSHSASPDPRLKNARGVCLMRMGSYEKAVRVFRELAMGPAAALREDLPDQLKLNFATSLLLHGLMSGGLGVLAEVEDQTLPGVQYLQAAIKQWKGTLSLWERVNWWLGADPKRPFTLDYPPGEIY